MLPLPFSRWCRVFSYYFFVRPISYLLSCDVTILLVNRQWVRFHSSFFCCCSSSSNTWRPFKIQSPSIRACLWDASMRTWNHRSNCYKLHILPVWSNVTLNIFHVSTSKWTNLSSEYTAWYDSLSFSWLFQRFDIFSRASSEWMAENHTITWLFILHELKHENIIKRSSFTSQCCQCMTHMFVSNVYSVSEIKFKKWNKIKCIRIMYEFVLHMFANADIVHMFRVNM